MKADNLTDPRIPRTLPAMQRALAISSFSAILAIAQSARAEEGGAPPPSGADAAVADTKAKLDAHIGNSFGGGLLFGALGEDFYATLFLRLNLDFENFGIGFGAPLRLRLIDNDPQNDDDIGGIIRKEDWDEVSDFLKIIRYVYVGNPNKTGVFYGRIGELSGLTVGHGTIVNRYYNGFDPNRWRVGVNIAVNVGPVGAEVVMGDIAKPDDPALVGARGTVRPLGLILGEGFWEKLVFGVSFMADPTAPLLLSRNAMGGVVIDDTGHPVVQETDSVYVTGVDVAIELLEGDPLTITPYIDLNKVTDIDEGWGLHIGILWALRFPLVLDTLMIDLRTEYRRVSGDYLSPYFNTTHEIDRFEYPAGSQRTKLASLQGGNFGGRNGVYFDLIAGLPEWVLVSGEYIDYDGGQNDGSLRLGLIVPALEFVNFSAFYYRSNISGLDDLFAIDDRSTVVAKVSVPVYSVFTIDGSFKRMWEPDPAAAGSYQAVDDWSVGFGFNIDF